MKKTLLPFLLLFVAALNTVSAQDGKKIDEAVGKIMRESKIPGVAVAVIKEGKLVYAKGYGFANVEHKVPVAPDTIFQTGSVGKQFTSAAIMLLVEDGKIKLDEKIGTYIPDLPESWDGITVRHLLTHTSGLGDYADGFDFRKDYTEDELLEIIKGGSLRFTPGEKFGYSNHGYVTLGILVHKVSGKFYGDFLKERVFGPLGMNTARVINEADIIANRAAGYELKSGELKNQEWVSPALNTTGDGALYVTIKDLAQWDKALFENLIFTPKSRQEMWTPVKLNDGTTHNYGFGWRLGQAVGGPVIGHTGSWQGFRACISRFVNQKITVIALANLAQADAQAIVWDIAKTMDPQLVRANEE